MSATVIIWENRSGDPATLADCTRLQSAEGLNRVTVAIPADPDAFNAAGLDNRHVHLVTQRGRVLFRTQFNDSTFQPVLNMALGYE